MHRFSPKIYQKKKKSEVLYFENMDGKREKVNDAEAFFRTK